MSQKSNKEKDNVVVQRIDDVIKNIENKNFTMYFFVADSKNIPNGSTVYAYNIAKTMMDSGYNVKMLYQLENEYTKEEIESLTKNETPLDDSRVFVGVGEWLGSEYMEIPHLNISREEWTVSPADFLFIPEIFSGMMFETFKHKAPCKRYVLLQNSSYVTEFIPMGVEWVNYGITDAIATTEALKNEIIELFPYVKAQVLNPGIPDYFRKPIEPKKLIIGIVAKSTSIVNEIIKKFYWKNPVYKFVSFRYLNGFNREDYAKLLKESAIVVWVDDNTQFGYSALEAIKTGNILIGKIPQDIPEWMLDSEDQLTDAGVWFNNMKDIPSILASVIGAWMNDSIPEELLKAAGELSEKYSNSTFIENTKSITNSIIEDRISELTAYKDIVNNKKNEENK